MRKRIRKGMIGVLALVMAAGAAPSAFAVLPNDMNLRLNGSEIVGPTQYSIVATGQEVVAVGGHFFGDETFTYVQSGASGATAVCGGSISDTAVITLQTGSIGTLGQGQFNITMTFTPSSGTSGTPCDVTDYTFLCDRTLQHRAQANDLNVGEYDCVATGVTVGTTPVPVPASLEGRLRVVGGSGSPQG